MATADTATQSSPIPSAASEPAAPGPSGLDAASSTAAPSRSIAWYAAAAVLPLCLGLAAAAFWWSGESSGPKAPQPSTAGPPAPAQISGEPEPIRVEPATTAAVTASASAATAALLPAKVLAAPSASAAHHTVVAAEIPQKIPADQAPTVKPPLPSTEFPLALTSRLSARCGVIVDRLILLQNDGAPSHPTTLNCPHCGKPMPFPLAAPRNDLACPNCKKVVLRKGESPDRLTKKGNDPAHGALAELRARPAQVVNAGTVASQLGLPATPMVLFVLVLDQPASVDEALAITLETPATIAAGQSALPPGLFGIELDRVQAGIDRAITRIGFTSTFSDSPDPLISALAWLAPFDATWGRVTVQLSTGPRLEELVLPPLYDADRLAAIRQLIGNRSLAPPPAATGPVIDAEATCKAVLSGRSGAKLISVKVRVEAAASFSAAFTTPVPAVIDAELASAALWASTALPGVTRCRFSCTPVSEFPADATGVGASLAVAMESLARGFALDPQAVVLGGLSDSGGLLPISDAQARIQAAQEAGIRVVVLPSVCAAAVADLAVLGRYRAALGVQTISVTSLEDAVALVRFDRSLELVEALTAYATWKDRDPWSLPIAQQPDCVAALQKITTLVPGHLPAHLVLARGAGKEPRILSESGTEAVLRRYTVEVLAQSRLGTPAADRRVNEALAALKDLPRIADPDRRHLVDLVKAWMAAAMAVVSHDRDGAGGQRTPTRQRDREVLANASRRARDQVADALGKMSLGIADFEPDKSKK